ncbi:large-conductance mechanosensitive channel protein MscL [Micavibrio aeruginosavorus]|uniref:Large-conductance mechanosensitive channel n=1 Tax=Micavibrio aeruginosavorus EPB TaxID=349215 RepID=M4VF87_9BACT|nr:large-conductance mechanosensitive channel protein MscL [Micavibrio aeruginosavorus]AGH97883.1 Large-conductance mechanosensitive channel [Micavibrio aeruginosavorus EPB]
MKIINEFREFAMRGNVIDLAVGIVIGTAFGSITNSLVKDVIMPPIGVILGKVDFSKLSWTMIEATDNAAAVTLNYGLFIQSVVNFVIVAWAMFMIIKVMNTLKRKQEAGAADAPPPPKQEVLLEEIRDLLKNK